MCGIAGFTIPAGLRPEVRRVRYAKRLAQMTASLTHRGPDTQRALLLDGVAFGHTRLAIVDLVTGAQPMRDPRTGVTIVFNGEIFNYRELRELSAGYPFRTRSDTEVILARYADRGIDCVLELNGQFAFALFDPRMRALWLARDRVGILPLHYARTPEGLAFASEAKALFAGAVVRPALDRRALKQTLQLWSPVPPRTMFEGVTQLPPASIARWTCGSLQTWSYWDVDLDRGRIVEREEADAQEQLGALLESAVALRLRADVPVAAYLSGGLDSSLLSAIAQRHLGGRLATFSIAFAERAFDERGFQEEVARRLGTTHRSVLVTDREIAELLPAMVRHGEQVVVRTAPAPLLRLSALVRAAGTKVVLTGEGSDEIFLGYDQYAEARVRLFWSRQPGSTLRPGLLARLYPYLPLEPRARSLWREFFAIGIQDPDGAAFTHLPRWVASGRTIRFLSGEFAASVQDEDPIATLVASLPDRVLSWRPLARAQYLEMRTLLSGYLLSAQGDRMLMGNSVEGRFPYLDHRLIEFAASLPDELKLRGLTGKWLLRRYAARWLPESIHARPKFPYRAPIAAAVAGPDAPEWARDLLGTSALRANDIFDATKVERLLARLRERDAPASEADAQALAAVATTQLLVDQLLRAVTVPEHDSSAVEVDVDAVPVPA